MQPIRAVIVSHHAPLWRRRPWLHFELALWVQTDERWLEEGLPTM